MKIEEIERALLYEVKEKLLISWEDNDLEVKRIIIRAANYIQSKVSQEITINSDFEGYDLFLERCRYDWNNALDEFEQNYASEILSFIQLYALKDWRESNEKSKD